MPLVTAKSHFKYEGIQEYIVRLRGWAEQAGLSRELVPLLVEMDVDAEPAVGYVNHGNLVADCPTGDGGAMFLSPDLPGFFCGECFNAELKGKWRPHVLPPNLEGIETVLVLRPKALNRNWLPGESLGDLKRENSEHGLGES